MEINVIENNENVSICSEDLKAIRLRHQREVQRKCAKKKRDELKQLYGTCLTEEQKQYNKNYINTHYEEFLAYKRRWYAQNKAKKQQNQTP